MVEIRKQLEILEELVRQAEKDLNSSGKGTLVIETKGKKTEWYIHQKNQPRRYLSKKEIGLARGMAQAAYAREFLKAAERVRKELRRLEQWGAERSAGVMYRALARPYGRLPVWRKGLVRAYVLPDEEFAKAWEGMPFEGKGFAEDAPALYTEKGERVRSKSEKMIADKLLRMGVRYRYEFPTRLKGYGIVHSDFTLLDLRERIEVKMEHFGRMDDPGYVEDNLWKFSAYPQNGFLLGDTFLCTFESLGHPVDLKAFERMIRTRFF